MPLCDPTAGGAAACMAALSVCAGSRAQGWGARSSRPLDAQKRTMKTGS